MAFDIQKIEEKIDKTMTASMAVSTADVGGIRLQSGSECMEMAKALATANIMVPPHLRGRPGDCLGIILQAIEWGLPVMAVANKSYIVNNKGVERVAYESQLIHALIEKRAPIKGRLRHKIIGTGDERTCRVWATFTGETEPHEYTSPTLGESKQRIGRNENGKIKGSPLWDSKPELQMFYDASRDWARMHCPDVLLGAYAPDEFDGEPVDVTPTAAGKPDTLTQRLRDQRAKQGATERHGRGFDASFVESEVNSTMSGSKTIEGKALSSNAEQTADERTDDGQRPIGDDEHQGRQDDATDTSSSDDAVGSANADRDAQWDEESSAGEGEARAQEGRQEELDAADDPLGPGSAEGDEGGIKRKGGTRRPAGRK